MLRTICERETVARHELGDTIAEELKHRLADLRAATSIDDLLIGNLQKLDEPDRQCLAIDLIDEYRLVFCANHPKNPVTESGKVNWRKVSRIKITHIGKAYV